MNLKSVTILLLAIVWLSTYVQAQSNSPVEHMDYLNTREEGLSTDYLSYISEVAHGGRARKMEKRRTELINSIKTAQRDAARLRPYKGDATLRNAYAAYWSILLSVFNEDYHKIIDMEEVAEQSYDAMEAYLLAQDKASEKLNEAYDKVPLAYNAFAAKHNVTLTQGQTSKLDRKVSQANSVNKYFRVLYLIMFKASVQEDYLTKGLNAHDINAVEQSRASLLKYTEEGLAKLDTLKPYKGDGSLVNNLTKVMNFYKAEASTDIQIQSDYLLKADEFEKIKQSYNKKGPTRSTADVSTYNKAVEDINKATVANNKSITTVNNARNKVLNNWEVSKKRFMDAHMPHQ